MTGPVSSFASQLVNRKLFKILIIILILMSAILSGIETYSNLAGPHRAFLHLVDYLIVWCFVGEIILKIAAHGGRPWDYFTDPWNVFDFIIVGLCLLPVADTHYVAVFRIARILRVLRMIPYIPKLRLLIGALLKSIPSMGYVILLLSLLFYIYGILGSFMFGNGDPAHFGNLHLSLITLFKVLTLEGWTEILNIHLYTDDPGKGFPVEVTSVWPLLYFVSFILLGAMIIMNLFIGVIMNSMEESQRELEQQMGEMRRDDQGAVNILSGIEAKLDELKREVANLKGKL
jgi:voltage-gated sodium channel